MFNKDQIVIYKDKDGEFKVDVTVRDEMVWLSLNQLVELFGRDKSVISRHIKNIFKEQELSEVSTVANFATVQMEGDKSVTRQLDYYNLDMIISVGYRVNSKKAVEFRKWASGILKDYLLKGYSVNYKKIMAKELDELKQTIDLLSNTLINQNLVDSEGEEILSLIKNYAKTWDILIKYDENRLELPQTDQSRINELTYDEAISAIQCIKLDLGSKGEAIELFGKEKDNSLKGILGSIYQTFDGNDLYPSLEEKIANLIYFVIKDHPFTDGNKRIGCFLFLLLMQKNKMLLPNIPTPEALTAIALLIAESNPIQKDLIIKLVINLIERKQS